MTLPAPSGASHTASEPRDNDAARPKLFWPRRLDLKGEPIVRSLCLGSLALLFAVSNAMAAGDPVAGRKAAAKCQVCHGVDGQSKNPEAPHISGQVERYIIKALKRYQSGERQDPMMSMIVKQLKEDDIANLAAYYSSIKVTVEKPK
jgi:cytochrome c553